MNISAYITFVIISPANACIMIILNIIEIVFIHKMNMKKRARSTIFISNLAVSDIFLGIILATKVLMELAKGLPPDHPIPLCSHYLRRSLIQSTLFVSVVTNTVLTTERFISVKKPFIYQRITQRTKKVCLHRYLALFTCSNSGVLFDGPWNQL